MLLTRQGDERLLNRYPLFLPAVISGLICFLCATFIFPFGSINCDSTLYLWMADVFKSRRINYSAPTDTLHAIWPWLTSIHGGAITPKYQPGYPLLLASMWPHFRVIVLILVSCLSTLVIGRFSNILGGNHIKSAWIWVLSPLVIVQSGLYLPYIFSSLLGFSALMVICGDNQASSKKSLLTGLLIGLLLNVRPLDCLIFLLSICIFIVRRDNKRIGRQLIGLTLGALPGVLLALWWNWHQTGSYLSLPFSLTSPHDTIGFGLRKVYEFEHGITFTPKNGVINVVSNLTRVFTWAALGPILLMNFRSGWRALQAEHRHLLLALAMFWIIGYGCFYGSYVTSRLWRGADYVGPFYWIPILTVLILVGSQSSGTAQTTQGERIVFRIGILSTIGILVFALHRNFQLTESWRGSAEMRIANQQNSLVVMDPNYTQWIGAPLPFFANAPVGRLKFVLNFDEAKKIEHDSGQLAKFVALQNGNSEATDRPIMVPISSVSSPPKLMSGNALATQIVRKTAKSCDLWTLPRTFAIRHLSITNVPSVATKCRVEKNVEGIHIQQYSVSTGKLLQVMITYRIGAKKYWVARLAVENVKSGKS